MSQLADLLAAFRAGARDLEHRGGLLNNINVYPVVDGDTGINMVASLQGALKIAASEDFHPSDSQQLKDIAIALIEGGRGNSGVILTSYLAGVFDSLANDGSISGQAFIRALEAGCDLAYLSVRVPVEGTILTAMRGLSDALSKHRGQWSHGDVEAASLRLAALVTETKAMLPQLAAADVVDSGALGFYILASSMILYLPCTGSDAPMARAEIQRRLDGKSHQEIGEISTAISARFEQTPPPDESDYTYCVTALLNLSGTTNEEVFDVCQQLGGSIDLSRLGSVAKVHLHTNDLDRTRQRIENLGTMREFIYEKMSIAKSPSPVSAADEGAPIEQTIGQRPIKIVTDASASLSEEIAVELEIARLQTHVTGHGRMLKDDDVDLDSLFAGMRKGHIYTTAQTSPSDARIFLDQQLAHCEQLIYIGMGHAYSGTQNVIRDVAANHPDSHRISIVDSKAASGQLALACIASSLFAATQATGIGPILPAQTKNDSLLAPPQYVVSEVLDYIAAQIGGCREYLVIDNLKHLARGGRIGKVKASFAGLLSIKPIVGHGDTGATTYAKTRTHDAAVDAVLMRIKAHPGDGRMAFLLEYTDNKQWVEALTLKIKREISSDAIFYLAPLSPSSAVHMGPGTWGIAVTRL